MAVLLNIKVKEGQMEKYKVRLRVVEIQGTGKCPLGHRIGDEFTYEGWTIPNLCPAAFNILYPVIRVLSYGGRVGDSPNEYKIQLCCYDPANPTVFQLERLEEKY